MRLQNWLLEVIKDDPSRFEEVALTIGPQGSYFARYKTSHLTHALPKDLRIAIADASAAPQNIALGVRGAWCATWSDGTLKSNLCNAYPTLEKSNAFANDTKAPVFVALNPFVEDQYFVVGLDGSCSYKHQLDREDSQYVHDKTDTYMRMRARRDGTTFDHFTHLEGRADRKICITPVSNVVETRIDNYKAILRAQEGPIDRRTLIGIGAIAGGSVVLARAARIPIKRTAAPLVAMGFGAAVSSWYHGAF